MRGLNKKRLGDLLVEAGKITEQQLKTELAKQRVSGIKLGELLVQDKILTEDDIMDVLEVQLGIERVYLDMIQIDRRAVKAIPESLASKYILIPIGYEKDKIKVATNDPLNIFALDDVSISTGKDVIPVIATKKEVERAIDKYYATQYVERAAEALSKSQISSAVVQEEEIDDVKNAPVVKLIDSVIKNAIKSNASDIHIEPFEKYIKIRYRVDGTLQEVLRTPMDNLPALVTRIKILSNLNIAEKRIPQDGRIIMEVENRQVDLRVSVLPTIHGEKIVIRILKKDSFLLKKDKLGMNKDDIEKLERMIKSPYGIILVTGPTGSGKSTTLYAMLNELNSSETNIITVEDPVEYMMDGINQVNVNMKAGLTFANGLRSILRQDPDVVMIGEIRDEETAEIAVRAAITGHLVLSTVHTNDAASAIVRLEDMGIESYLISASISGVIAQRLVRKTCSKCKEAYEANEYEKSILNLDKQDDLKLYRGKGCTYCNNTGYSGRTGIYEIMEISKEHRELIQSKGGTEEIKELNLKNGIRTLKMACSDLVLKGETTIEELAKVAFLKE
ncbi:type II secretion system protein GspE [Clostridium bovifaecis]|uniref:Type II secretion system protein GspE n=1 Tax=Clostridium bovifaecis TaxID=2184719 RepID=A0A6I6FD53_9CLOT|nr:type II secretion system protein GspE [Clostridium bovifaecis]